MNATRWKRSTLSFALMWATLLLGVDTCDDFNLGQLPGEEDAGSGTPDAGQGGSDACDDCDEGEYCERTACGSDEGTCVTLPEACTDQYEPVCGCDGKTYGNDCYAAAAGVTVASQGECEDDGGDDEACDGCDEGEYCERTACGSDEGTCQTQPDVCTDQYEPVCGCDGETYGNDCHAAGAGMTVASQGECEDDGGDDEACDQCRDTEYCKVDACGSSEGTCTVVPEACDAQYLPVCGCDGETYGNACTAAAQGVNVASEGACEDPCGGACGDNEYCKTDSCGADTGQCTEMGPIACTLDYTPVCGCDGKTYGNACAAESAGANIASEGECGGDEGEQCGGIAGITCSNANDFCDYERGTGCVTEDGGTIADASGFCQQRPEACLAIYDPVCGCDGQTYGNRCTANSDGVSVAHEGECSNSK